MPCISHLLFVLHWPSKWMAHTGTVSKKLALTRAKLLQFLTRKSVLFTHIFTVFYFFEVKLCDDHDPDFPNAVASCSSTATEQKPTWRSSVWQEHTPNPFASMHAPVFQTEHQNEKQQSIETSPAPVVGNAIETITLAIRHLTRGTARKTQPHRWTQLRTGNRESEIFEQSAKPMLSSQFAMLHDSDL